MEFALDAFRGGCQALDQHLSSIYTQECPGLGVHLGELVQTVAISPSVFCLASISHSARWTAHHGLKHTGDWGGGIPLNLKNSRGRSTRRPNQTRFHHLCRSRPVKTRDQQPPLRLYSLLK